MSIKNKMNAQILPQYMLTNLKAETVFASLCLWMVCIEYNIYTCILLNPEPSSVDFL